MDIVVRDRFQWSRNIFIFTLPLYLSLIYPRVYVFLLKRKETVKCEIIKIQGYGGRDAERRRMGLSI